MSSYYAGFWWREDNVTGEVTIRCGECVGISPEWHRRHKERFVQVRVCEQAPGEGFTVRQWLKMAESTILRIRASEHKRYVSIGVPESDMLCRCEKCHTRISIG